MKRIIALFMAMITILGIGGVAVAAGAADENLCGIFSDRLENYCTYYGHAPVSVWAVSSWVRGYLLDYPELYEKVEEQVTEDYTRTNMRVSKDVFNSVVEMFYVLDKSYDEMIAADPDSDHYVYDDGDSYIIIFGGAMGGGTKYYLKGYVKDKDTYSVYFQEESFFRGFPDEEEFKEELEYFKSKYDWSDEEAESRVHETDDGFYAIWLDGYRYLTVSYDGEYVRIINGGNIDSIPSVDDMVTPEPEISVEEPEAPAKVVYDLCDGVRVYGDDAFPEGTVVRVELITSGDILNKAITAMHNSEKNYINNQIYEFTATCDGAVIQPNGKVKVVFDIPRPLVPAGWIELYYVTEDGFLEAVGLETSLDLKTGTVELERFGTYVLADTSIAFADDEPEQDGGGLNNPQTGDALIYILGVIALVTVSAGVVLLCRKKRTVRATPSKML